MDIVCSTDCNYIQHCGVLITSVFENNKDENVCFHILTDSIDEKYAKILKQIADSYKQQIVFYYIDKSSLKDCPIRENDRLSIATYFRILIPNILPQSINKVIYLDCDIVVRGKLVELWNNNIDNVAIGCVIDGCSALKEHYQRLCYDQKYGYFNAGMLLMNLQYWRKNEIVKRVLEYINMYPEKLLLWDQDALNFILKDKKVYLPLQYNVQESFFLKKNTVYNCNESELETAIFNPIIVHYTGIKPWYKECIMPYAEEYIKYKRLTIWRDIALPHIRKIQIRRWFRKCAVLSHLCELTPYRKIPLFKK